MLKCCELRKNIIPTLTLQTMSTFFKAVLLRFQIL